MSSSREQTQLTVRILGRDYQVACPENEREALLASAEYLSKRMTAIQKKGKTLGMERIAVMAGLNMARDLVDEDRRKQRAPVDKQVGERLQQLQIKIESALDNTG